MLPRSSSNLLLCFFALLCAQATASSLEPEILLKKHCSKCHGSEKQKGELRLDSRPAILKGGESGTSLVLGKPEKSFLFESLAEDSDNHMPPKSQLGDEEIAALKQWIADDAPWRAEVYERPLVPVLKDEELSSLPADYVPILTTILSPDGTSLLAGRGQKVLRFEVGDKGLTNQESLDLPHPDIIQSLAWHPDGNQIATASYRKVIISSPDGSNPVTVDRDGLLGRITAMDFANGGALLLLADSPPAAPSKVHFVNPKDGSIRNTIEAHRDAIYDLQVSRDGKQFATASADKLVRVWNVSDRSLVRTLEGHTGYALAVAWRPSGAPQLATSGDDKFIKVWDLKTGKLLSDFGKGRITTRLHWSVDPDQKKKRAAEKDEAKKNKINTDRILGITEDGAPWLYKEINYHEGEQRSVGAKEKAFTISDSETSSLAVNEKTLHFVAGSMSGDLRTWDANGKLLSTWPSQEEGAK